MGKQHGDWLAGFTKQCAWCQRLQEPDGQYGRRAPNLIRGLTHGICPDCKARWVAEADQVLDKDAAA